MKHFKTFAILLIAGLAASLPVLTQETVRRLTQEEAVKAAIAKPQPDYPPIARQLKLEGRVEVEVSIEPSGTVGNARALTGNPALTGSAVNAVKRWKFQPVTSDGKPVRAITVIAFTFKQ
jgi:protein TonB